MRTVRPDPVDWGARTALSLALLAVVLAAVAAVVEALGGATPLPAVPYLEWLVLPVAALVTFGVLTLWYYRQTVRGESPAPFPASLGAPWEGVARFVGVLFLLYVAFLATALALVVPQLLGVPVLADVANRVEPAAVVLSPVLLFAYLAVWYARHPDGDDTA